MGRQKKPKLEKFKLLSNCFDSTSEEFDLKHLHSLLEDKDITLELGCGKAELSIGLAKKYPDRFFVGVDVKADRLQRAGAIANEAGLNNIVLLRANVENINDFIEPGSVSEIWVTFPDPYPKDRHAKRRLVGTNFLNLYATVLKQGGKLNFKTDNLDLFNFGIDELSRSKEFETANQIDDLQASDLEDAKIMTTFESRFVGSGQKINYLLATRT